MIKNTESDFQSFKKKIGTNIRELRKNNNNLSQFKLALACDIDKNMPSLIELGEIAVGLEILYKISNELKCHPSIVMLDKDTDKDIIELINSRYKDNF